MHFGKLSSQQVVYLVSKASFQFWQKCFPNKLLSWNCISLSSDKKLSKLHVKLYVSIFSTFPNLVILGSRGHWIGWLCIGWCLSAHAHTWQHCHQTCNLFQWLWLFPLWPQVVVGTSHGDQLKGNILVTDVTLCFLKKGTELLCLDDHRPEPPSECSAHTPQINPELVTQISLYLQKWPRMQIPLTNFIIPFPYNSEWSFS